MWKVEMQLVTLMSYSNYSHQLIFLNTKHSPAIVLLNGPDVNKKADVLNLVYEKLHET